MHSYQQVQVFVGTNSFQAGNQLRFAMARSVILCSWSPWWTAFGTWPTMNRRSRETSDIAQVETLSIWHRNVSPDLYVIMSSFIWSFFIFNEPIIWPYFTMWKIFGSPNVAWRKQRLWIEQRPMVRWIVWPLWGRTQWPLDLGRTWWFRQQTMVIYQCII